MKTKLIHRVKLAFLLICLLPAFSAAAKYINVSRPEAGSVGLSGSMLTITWESQDVSQVDIFYSMDNGNSWNLIQSGVNSYTPYYGLSYSWRIPEFSGIYPHSLIMLRDSEDQEVVGYSQVFTLQGQIIRFVDPGEGSSHDASQQNQLPVRVEMLEDQTLHYTLYLHWWDLGGAREIASGSISGKGMHTIENRLPLTVPSGNFFLSMVYEVEGYLFFKARSPEFSIVNDQPSLQLASPAQGDTLLKGQTASVAWNSVNIPLVDIFLSSDKGQSWQLMAEAVASRDGINHWAINSYSWPVPLDIPTPEGQYMIRISSHQQPLLYADSGVFFIADPPLVIIQPTEETVIEHGQDLEIILDIRKASEINIWKPTFDEGLFILVGEFVEEGTFTIQAPANLFDPDRMNKIVVYHEKSGAAIHSEEFSVVHPSREPGIKIVAEGVFAPNGPRLMHTLLNEQGLLPLVQPFGKDMSEIETGQPLWFHKGIERVGNMGTDVVDWVLVELRDAPGPELAYYKSVVARQAALLHADGAIKGADGQPLKFNVFFRHGMHVVVYHLNHLPVMSAEALTPADGSYSWDFSRGQQQAYGGGQKQLADGVYGLPGGDADGDGRVSEEDITRYWVPQAGSSGYLEGDFDLNGQVQLQDKNNLLVPNQGMVTTIPWAMDTGSDGQPCPGMPTITDARDGNVYQTVLIGSQCWLKENMKYLPRLSNPFSEGPVLYYVYQFEGYSLDEALATENYRNYGVLYDQEAARGACPAGWHLPTLEEWQQLKDYLTGKYEITNGLANALKSCRQVNNPLGFGCNTTRHPRWREHSQNTGTDDFGFSALPGSLIGDDDYLPPYASANWWTADPSWGVRISQWFEDLQLRDNMWGALSVRCVREN